MNKLTRRDFVKRTAIVSAGFAVPWKLSVRSAHAAQSPQIPLAGAAIEHAVQRPFVTRVPVAPLLAQLLTAVALPASLGLVARSRRPHLVEHYRPLLRRIAFTLLALLLALSTGRSTR